MCRMPKCDILVPNIRYKRQVCSLLAKSGYTSVVPNARLLRLEAGFNHGTMVLTLHYMQHYFSLTVFSENTT